MNKGNNESIETLYKASNNFISHNTKLTVTQWQVLCQIIFLV